MAGWPKKNDSLIRRIDRLLSGAPVRRKNFFGTVAWFLESNDLIFAGAWGDGVMVRLGEIRSRGLIESGAADPHDPTGHRPKREYVLLAEVRIRDDAVLDGWFREAVEFVTALPANKKEPRRASGPDRQAGL